MRSLIKDVTIITDGPDTPDAAGYGALTKELQKRGYHVTLDRGLPGTAPEVASVWVGHGQGASRFHLCPRTTGLVEVQGDLVDEAAVEKVADAVDKTTEALQGAGLERELESAPQYSDAEEARRIVQEFEQELAQQQLQRAPGSKGEPFRLQGQGGFHFGVSRRHGPHLAKGPTHLYAGRIYEGDRRKGRELRLSPAEQELARRLLINARA